MGASQTPWRQQLSVVTDQPLPPTLGPSKSSGHCGHHRLQENRNGSAPGSSALLVCFGGICSQTSTQSSGFLDGSLSSSSFMYSLGSFPALLSNTSSPQRPMLDSHGLGIPKGILLPIPNQPCYWYFHCVDGPVVNWH